MESEKILGKIKRGLKHKGVCNHDINLTIDFLIRSHERDREKAIQSGGVPSDAPPQIWIRVASDDEFCLGD